MLTKQLADQALGAIALDRDAKLAGGGNAEPRPAFCARQREDNHVAALVLAAAIVDLLKLASLPDVLMTAESLIHHDCPATARPAEPQPRARMTLVRGHGEALAPLGPPPLQHDAAVFRRHPDQETVRPASPAIVGLISALHR